MRIEAFSVGKDPARPDANEDRLVVLPGRGYAVIDGVTDRVGARYDGMLAGQYGATLVADALTTLLTPCECADARALVPALTAAIEAAYARHGTLERARGDRNYRFSATLALALERADHFEILLVGDSGVRLGGGREIRLEKDLDLVTATLRREAWNALAARGVDGAARQTASRRVALHGSRLAQLDLAGALDEADLAAIEREAVAAALARMPHLPRADVERLVQGGIVNAQGDYQNARGSALGYSCLDGFEVAMEFVHHERVAREAAPTVELYTDGSFKPGDGFGVDSWERAFAEVEAEDPAKIGRYPSAKGTLGAVKADDRTYLGVAFARA